jgi:hypothetical protein
MKIRLYKYPYTLNNVQIEVPIKYDKIFSEFLGQWHGLSKYVNLNKTFKKIETFKNDEYHGPSIEFNYNAKGPLEGANRQPEL